ncbi:MAG: hypothetical protein MR748_08935 [Clostridiales bacterium]|nr:hypothetical protein [Clostridiales bacterium]
MSRACNHAANGRVTKKANDRNTNSRQSQKTKKSPKANRHISFSFQFWGQEKLPDEQGAQSVKKVEVQEALPPAGVIGAAPLTLVPQHFPRKPA